MSSGRGLSVVPRWRSAPHQVRIVATGLVETSLPYMIVGDIAVGERPVILLTPPLRLD